MNISFITHDIQKPTGPDLLHIEKDIIIGDNFWTGSNLFIREGVFIGDNVILDTNSVVTKNFNSGAVIADVPAKVIRELKIE